MNDKIDDYLYHRIIPDLLASTRSLPNTNKPGIKENGVKFISLSDIKTFSEFLKNNQIKQANSIVQNYLDIGYIPSKIVELLVCKSAHYLGEQWCSNDVSFVEITIGMVALHRVLRDLDADLSKELGDSILDRSILLASMSKDTHLFGVAVLESFFRNSDWNVHVEQKSSVESIAVDVANTHFSAIGISISQSRHIDECKNMISQIRQHSKNRQVKIMVGGFPFIADDMLYKDVGADAFADNALQALQIAGSIFHEGV